MQTGRRYRQSIYMKGNKGEVKTEMKENTVPKTEKER